MTERLYADVIIGAHSEPVVWVPSLKYGIEERYVRVADGWYRHAGYRPLFEVRP